MDYWGTTDITKAYHVSRAAVHKWKSTNYEGFPDPIAVINDGTNPVWDAEAVRKWREKTVRERRLSNKAHQARLRKKNKKRGKLKRRSKRKPVMSEQESQELTHAASEALRGARAKRKTEPVVDYDSLVDDILKR